jgi:hypothetical protein
MNRIAMCVVLHLLLCSPATAQTPEPERTPVINGPGLVYMSHGTGALAARETAGPDTFVLYGGPDHPTQGKFQLANELTPDWGGGNGLPGGYGGGPDAWTPVDLTWQPLYWHVSTFNAENLNDNGPGNRALWCGVAADDPLAEDWGSPPGLGNNWFDSATYESAPLADPSVGQEVDLEFYFNYDLADVMFDFFHVQYDSAGSWVTVLTRTGFSRDASDEFPAPGRRFSVEQDAPILFTGHDYGGDAGDRIRIRLLVTSDGVWSDEDGIAPSVAGAVQVDDVALTTSQGTFTEDFEGPGPYLFEPFRLAFAGDFADVYPHLTDIDPCRDNLTPVAGFIDYDQVVRNGPGVGGETRTGGSTNPAVHYGIPGNWVLNGYGGLSGGEEELRNEIWSPVIAWDLPGTADDGLEFSGATLSFSVWSDLNVYDGMFYAWHVRMARQGEAWANWADYMQIYYDGTAQAWINQSFDLTEIVAGYNPERIQVALAAWDYSSVFGFGDHPGTPSPCFDNVTVRKYRLDGPSIYLYGDYAVHDGFPVLDSIDVSSPAARDALDVPFSITRDINSGRTVIAPGDSLIVRLESYVPGTRVDDRWAGGHRVERGGGARGVRSLLVLRAGSLHARVLPVAGGPAGRRLHVSRRRPALLHPRGRH